MIYQENYPSFGEDDKQALRELIRNVARPGCRMLEIGSWLGAGSTRVLVEELSSLADAWIYCVDTWEGSPNVASHREIAASYDVFKTFRHNVAEAGGAGMVHPLVMPSGQAAAIMADGQFDLVFIDGDHSYAATKNDIAVWLPKVRPGGILCGHDCECRPQGSWQDLIQASRDLDHIPGGDGIPFAVVHPGVVLAVDEAFGGLAHLWAEELLMRPDGTEGRATLWDVVVAEC